MRGSLARSSRKAPKVQIYTLPVKTKARILALLLKRSDLQNHALGTVPVLSQNSSQ